MSSLASYIDHTILKPTTSHIEINRICKEALEWRDSMREQAAELNQNGLESVGDDMAAVAGIFGLLCIGDDGSRNK